MSDSLRKLLEQVDPRVAAAFVEQQIGPLVAHDREHGTHFARELERSLDEFAATTGAAGPIDGHETRRALEMVPADLEVPEVRLAIQVALRLRKLADH
jgi:hypothetical protein